MQEFILCSCSHRGYKGCGYLDLEIPSRSCSSRLCCYYRAWVLHSPFSLLSNYCLSNHAPYFLLKDQLIPPSLPEKNKLILINENIEKYFEVLTIISLCWTNWSWDISCCCCSCRCCSPGEDLLRSDCSKWVCWTKLTWSCSWSCGINCSSCFLPESASWLTLSCMICCICAGLIAPKGLCSSCCMCCRPGGRRGSCNGGVTFPGSDSLQQEHLAFCQTQARSELSLLAKPLGPK